MAWTGHPIRPACLPAPSLQAARLFSGTWQLGVLHGNQMSDCSYCPHSWVAPPPHKSLPSSLKSFYSFCKAWFRHLNGKVTSSTLSLSLKKTRCLSPVVHRKLPGVTLGVNEPYIQLSPLLGCKVFDFRTCINSF